MPGANRRRTRPSKEAGCAIIDAGRMASLDLNGIAKSYDGQRAVDGIDLHIPDGALACLLGPSGCGKTTTLRLIAGFMSPDAGEIRVGGEVLSSPARTTPPEARRMSMVFQSYALWPHMTVARNVAYGLELRGMAREEIRRRVDSILAVTRIGALAERYPGELSGGQQQRAALARALAVEPQTLLLDEPLSNLDANLREEMRFEIRRLHQEYKYTTVYVTHDQAEAMTAADLIVVMNGGRIEQVGSPEEVYRHPRSRFVAGFIGGANILEGRALARDTVAVDGRVLRCAEGEAGSGTTAVSIRLHDVRLADAPFTAETNAAQGTVARQIYLGGYRDYLVALPGGLQLRATAPMALDVAAGAPIYVYLPPEHCRALAS
jgi:iron(III) transport system ATP-binding protein